jgi:hypothetical protein
MRWELTFDSIPPGPNHRLHWAKKAGLTSAWRQMAMLKAQEARIPMQERIRLSARFLRARLGVADEDNDRARLKPVADGLVDAGVIRKDTRGHIEWGPVTEEHGGPGFVLVIESLLSGPAAERVRGKVS